MILVYRQGGGGDPVQVGAFLPATVAEATVQAAQALHPDEPKIGSLLFTLMDRETRKLLPRSGLAPTEGTFELIETGGLL